MTLRREAYSEEWTRLGYFVMLRRCSTGDSETPDSILIGYRRRTASFWKGPLCWPKWSEPVKRCFRRRPFLGQRCRILCAFVGPLLFRVRQLNVRLPKLACRSSLFAGLQNHRAHNPADDFCFLARKKCTRERRKRTIPSSVRAAPSLDL